MATQIGSDIILGDSALSVWYDVMEYGTNLKTKFKAIGTAGSEIGTLYKLADDNSYTETFTQVATATGATEFSYATATGLITFGSGFTPAKGDRFACAYNIDTGSSSQTIPVVAAGQPKTALVTAFGLVKDVETGEFYQAQINGLGQISGAWAWELAADGEPASQTMDIEFVKKYSAKNLYDITVWNEEDAVTVAAP